MVSAPLPTSASFMSEPAPNRYTRTAMAGACAPLFIGSGVNRIVGSHHDTTRHAGSVYRGALSVSVYRGALSVLTNAPVMSQPPSAASSPSATVPRKERRLGRLRESFVFIGWTPFR